MTNKLIMVIKRQRYAHGFNINLCLFLKDATLVGINPCSCTYHSQPNGKRHFPLKYIIERISKYLLNLSNIIDSNFGNFLLNRLPLVLIELRLWHVWCDMFLIFLGKWHSSTNGNKLDIILTCYRKYLTKGNIFELWSINGNFKLYLIWLINYS